MDRITALHTAVRRLCQERYAKWSDTYAVLDARGGARRDKRGGGWDYTEEARDIFPRYRILDAALVVVERFVPADFKSEDEARALLADAAASARAEMPELTRHPQSAATIDDEIAAFRAGVLALTDLDALTPLPFRRVLADAQTRQLERDVTERFGAWYGGVPDSKIDVEALTLSTDGGVLQARLEQLATIIPAAERLYELREWGPSYELEPAAARFFYTGAEVYLVPPSLAWMVYGSHEDTVSFVGSELVARVKSAWQDWRTLDLHSNS